MQMSTVLRVSLAAGFVQSVVSTCNYYSYYGLDRCNFNGENGYKYTCADSGYVYRSTWTGDDTCSGSSDAYNQALPLSQECDASKDCSSTKVITTWYSDDDCDNSYSKGVTNYVYACVYDSDESEWYTITCSEKTVYITYYKNSDCTKVDKNNIYYISTGCTEDTTWGGYYTVKCAASEISLRMIALLCGLIAVFLV